MAFAHAELEVGCHGLADLFDLTLDVSLLSASKSTFDSGVDLEKTRIRLDVVVIDVIGNTLNRLDCLFGIADQHVHFSSFTDGI